MRWLWYPQSSIYVILYLNVNYGDVRDVWAPAVVWIEYLYKTLCYVAVGFGGKLRKK